MTRLLVQHGVIAPVMSHLFLPMQIMQNKLSISILYKALLF